MKFAHGLSASAALTLLLVAALVGASGCPQSAGSYLFAQRVGNVQVQFVNTTPFRASFSFGSWDELDRRPPGAISFNQQRLAPNATTTPSNLPCRRNIAIGTQDMLDRTIATDADQIDTFDADAFVTGVNFSSAAADSPAAALPTEGTAAGREVIIGNDYSCGDLLIFTFVQDPDAAGGFRIDYELVRDAVRDEFGN